jgi:hypothetical protein
VSARLGARAIDHADVLEGDYRRVDGDEGLHAGGEPALREGREGQDETKRELGGHRDQL